MCILCGKQQSYYIGTNYSVDMVLFHLIYLMHFPVDTSMLEGMKKMFGVGKKKPKELVDPYIVCSFAGRKMQTKTMQGSYEPEWNEEVKLGFRVSYTLSLDVAPPSCSGLHKFVIHL